MYTRDENPIVIDLITHYEIDNEILDKIFKDSFEDFLSLYRETGENFSEMLLTMRDFLNNFLDIFQENFERFIDEQISSEIDFDESDYDISRILPNLFPY